MTGPDFPEPQDDYDAQDRAESFDETMNDDQEEMTERRTFEELPELMDMTRADGDRDDDEALALDADEFDEDAIDDADLEEDDELDYRALPNVTIEYELTDAEQAEIEKATALLRRAGEALGTFVAEPRLLPNGSSLHYMGTMRMGEIDDGSSVADPYSRVWDYENLVVGGNALIPTANTMNPTLMSVALAVRGARRAADDLEQQS